MDTYWKTLGAVFISAILYILLEQRGKDYALLLTLAACLMVSVTAAKMLSPVIGFLGELETLGNLSNDALKTLIKIFGIGIAGELAAAVCQDAGNASLGKGLQFLTGAAIFYLSIPVFSSLVELIQELLREV